jgi:transketolase
MTSTGLTRQNLPVLDRTPVEYAAAAGVARGGYVLSDGVGKDPDVLLVATGSEVQIALDAQQLLADDSIEARVVSMPCREWFTQQALDYQDEVLPSRPRPGQRRSRCRATVARGRRRRRDGSSPSSTSAPPRTTNAFTPSSASPPTLSPKRPGTA